MTPPRKPKQPSLPSCPVTDRGLFMRAACIGCQGAPNSGQRLLDRGDVLFLQGSPADRMYAVVTGWLREYSLDAEGAVGGARIVRAGQVIGLESLGARPEATYGVTVEALRPASVCVLGASSVGAWLKGRPEDALALAVAAAGDLADLRRQMLANASMSAEERVFTLVEELGSDAARGVWFRLPVTREQLGDVLGLTLETVSRMMQRLARAGRLEVSGARVRIC